jgi:nucleotide-binding universal stress UspA family protein
MARFQHILVATDFGEPSTRAVDTAIDLAKAFDATLTLVHVYEIPSLAYAGAPFSAVDLLTPIQEMAQAQVEREVARVRERVPGVRSVVRRGSPWHEILATIEDTHADLVVIGTHGRRGLSRALLGSVAEKIVRASPVPVLSVHDGSPPEPANA